MSAISKRKQDSPSPRALAESPDEILQRRRALESRVGASSANEPSDEPKGIAAEKPIGALCYLPKTIHRLATRYAENHDLTAKRFFLESVLIGLEQQGVITHEQHIEALALPNDYGWKGRKQ